MPSEGDPWQQHWLLGPCDQVLNRRRSEQLPQDEGGHIGVGQRTMRHSGCARVHASRLEPVPEGLIAVGWSIGPDPQSALVGAYGSPSSQVATKPLGVEPPIVGGEHIDTSRAGLVERAAAFRRTADLQADRTRTAFVKGFGCRPRALRPPSSWPASESLQGRNPRGGVL